MCLAGGRETPTTVHEPTILLNPTCVDGRKTQTISNKSATLSRENLVVGNRKTATIADRYSDPFSNNSFVDGRKPPAIGEQRANSFPIGVTPSLFWEPVSESQYFPKTKEALIITLGKVSDNRPYARVKIYDVPIVGLLDSGSQLTLINERVMAKFPKSRLSPLNQSLIVRSANGTELKILGQLSVPFNFYGKMKILRILVVKDLCVECILGMDFWGEYEIWPTMQNCSLIQAEELVSAPGELPSTLSEAERDRLEGLKQLFKVADGKTLSTTPLISHRIVISEEWRSKPPVRQYPYLFSPKIQDKVGREIDRLLSTGIIERAHSEWSSHIVPVIKPSGKIRLCLDARKVNERTVRDAYPLPHPGRILGQLPKAKYLSTIDLSEAFLQIPLEKTSRKFTAFSVQGKGMFQFTRLPFGLVNSPATLSRLMDQVLGHGELEPNVFVYLDDIVIVTDTFEHHARLLQEVAKRLSRANLSINLEKSLFGAKELPFLGYLLSADGLRANPEKIRPIVDYERPTTVTRLRRFLGMANYYRRFVDDFSGTTAPLTELLKSKSKILGWNEFAEKAFNAIKEKLISFPILTAPDFNREFTIQSDASDVAVAAVLTQVQDDQERVIAYFSHKLTTPQRNYHACEKEALAVLLAIEAFRGYIEGSHFTVITDSSALTHLMKTKWKTSSRCSRWCLSLQQHDMTIVHRKGKDNIVPDALSRSVAVVAVTSSTDWYNDLLDKVSQRPDQYPDFKVSEGNLYKYLSLPNFDTQDDRFAWKEVPIPEQRLTIISQAHDDSMHLGVDKTLSRIRMRYYWPRMTVEVREYVNKCTVCKESKAPNVAMAPEMGEKRLASHPWQLIALDFIGPLPRSKKQNQFILSVIDLYSKWVMLVPFKKIDSTAFTKVLQDQWFLRNSVPEVVITDNASYFLSKEFKATLDRFDIRHWLNTKYHSQANPVERLNRTVNAAIRTYARHDQRLWDSRLSEVEAILNSSQHTSTSLTPFFATHGYEMILKGTNYTDTDISNKKSNEIAERQAKICEETRKLVLRNLEKAYQNSRKRYNLRHRTYSKPFKVGEVVFRRNMQQSSALEKYNAKYGPQYLPARVVRKIGTSSYELEDMTGKSLGNWPATHLRPG